MALEQKRNPPCRAKTKPGELRASRWTAVLFIHWVRAGERQWSHWLQISALFLQCFSICEYHILFLSCTVLLKFWQILHRGCNWKLAEMKFCDFSWKHCLIHHLLPLWKRKNCSDKGGFLSKNIFPKLQNDENHLSTNKNNFCLSYRKILVQSPDSGKTANFVETNSTVLISTRLGWNG